MRRIVAVVLHVYTSVLSNALECHRIRTAFFFPIVNNREVCIDCACVQRFALWKIWLSQIILTRSMVLTIQTKQIL